MSHSGENNRRQLRRERIDPTREANEAVAIDYAANEIQQLQFRNFTPRYHPHHTGNDDQFLREPQQQQQRQNNLHFVRTPQRAGRLVEEDFWLRAAGGFHINSRRVVEREVPFHIVHDNRTETNRSHKLLLPIEGTSLTSDFDEPDMITYDCSESVRAIMPCGDIIGPQSLFDYCSDQLKRGKHEFKCAQCDAVWDYALVRHVACLDADEERYFQVRLSENFLNSSQGMQVCGSCGSWCCREDPSKDMVKCITCSISKGYTFYFCWSCLQEWKDGLDGKCGNDVCAEKLRRIQDQLNNCPLKELYDFECPSVRACPRCFTLIEHEVKCPHMTCAACLYEFCFNCLKKFSPYSWSFSPESSTCAATQGCNGVAPRQILDFDKQPVHSRVQLQEDADTMDDPSEHIDRTDSVIDESEFLVNMFDGEHDTSSSVESLVTAVTADPDISAPLMFAENALNEELDNTTSTNWSTNASDLLLSCVTEPAINSSAEAVHSECSAAVAVLYGDISGVELEKVASEDHAPNRPTLSPRVTEAIVEPPLMTLTADPDISALPSVEIECSASEVQPSDISGEPDVPSVTGPLMQRVEFPGQLQLPTDNTSNSRSSCVADELAINSSYDTVDSSEVSAPVTVLYGDNVSGVELNVTTSDEGHATDTMSSRVAEATFEPPVMTLAADPGHISSSSSVVPSVEKDNSASEAQPAADVMQSYITKERDVTHVVSPGSSFSQSIVALVPRHDPLQLPIDILVNNIFRVAVAFVLIAIVLALILYK